MATFTPISVNFEYTPISLQELNLPLAAYKAEYDKSVADIDTKRQGLAAFTPYINDMTPEAKAMYDALDEQIEHNAQYIGTPGYLLNERPIRALKAEYGKKVSDMTNAVKNLEERKALTQKEKSAHPGLVFNYRDSDGNIVYNPNIDNFLGNKNLDFYSVDTDSMMAKAATLAKGISSRLAHMAAGSNVRQTNDIYYGRVYEFQSKETGMPVQVALAWFLNPEKYKAEIENFKKNHKGEDYQKLFDGSVSDDIASLKAHSHYYQLDDENKAKVDSAIEFGFNSGLGPHDVIEHRNLGGAPSGGGGGFEVPNTPAVRMTPRIAVSEHKGTDAEKDFLKVAKYFNIDTDNFWQNEDIPVQDKFSLRGLNRSVGDDYKEGDKTLNELYEGKDFDTENGIDFNEFLDWFTPFTDYNGIIPKSDFNTINHAKVAKALSADYVEKMKGKSTFGDYYKKNYYGDATSRGITAQTGRAGGNTGHITSGVDSEAIVSAKLSDIYDNFAKATLMAYEVPKNEREEILNDHSGKKFEKWVEDNHVNKYSLQKQLWDMADKYANVTVNNQYFQFESNNEQIIKGLLSNSVTDKGTLNLKEIKQYKFKKNQNGVKEIHPELEDVAGGFDNIFPDNYGYKGITYMIPPDPSDGLIFTVVETGKSYLIEPKLLSGIISFDAVKSYVDTTKNSSKEEASLSKAIRDNFAICGKLSSGTKLSDKERKMLKSLGYKEVDNPAQYTENERNEIINKLEVNIKTLKNRRAAAMNTGQAAASFLTDYMKNTISTLYKTQIDK